MKAVDEDEYIEGLSKVIERDFFPDLKRIRLQNSFLDAVNGMDLSAAAHYSKELAELKNETIDNNSLSVDQFQAKYTSEDNASFGVLLEKDAQQRKEKYSWIFDSNKDRFLLEAPRTAMIEDVDANRDSKGKIGYWDYHSKNTLMYYPEGSTSEAVKERGQPKAINHKATRFENLATTAKEVLEDTLKTAERIRTEEVWKNMAKDTPGLFPRDVVSDSPRVQGYRYVAATPSPAPHRDVDPSELMTWGFIEGTPLLLESGQASGPSFKLPPTPRREELSMKLSEKASRNIRKRAQTPSTPSTSGWNAPSPAMHQNSRAPSPMLKRDLLSPAAANLLKRHKTPSNFGGAFKH